MKKVVAPIANRLPKISTPDAPIRESFYLAEATSNQETKLLEFLESQRTFLEDFSVVTERLTESILSTTSYY